MTKNDIFRRLRYAFELNDAEIVKIIAHTGEEVSVKQVVTWLKKETDHDCVEISDAMLCRFLDGFIIEKRGLRPDGTIPTPLEFLSNNEVLRKLRIALELRDEDMNAVFEKAEFVVTKAELSSFFRKEGHRNYRKCPEQVLRKFIQGLGRQREEPGESED